MKLRKLQKKELWDKREYYYQSDSLIISIYREIEQKVTDFFDTIFESSNNSWFLLSKREFSESCTWI